MCVYVAQQVSSESLGLRSKNVASLSLSLYLFLGIIQLAHFSLRLLASWAGPNKSVRLAAGKTNLPTCLSAI